MDVELLTPCAYMPRAKAEFRPFVYGLVDPREVGHVRYVGLAMQSRRPFAHAKRARKEGENHSHVLNWIRSLQAEAIDYAVLILEELPAGSSRKFVGSIEKMYIASLRSLGHDLTNTTEGGDGFSGRHRQESKEKARLAQIGKPKSAEHAANISKGKKGISTGPRTMESRANQSAAQMGHEVSVVTRKKIGDKRRGQAHTPETRETISKRLKGRKLAPEHAAAKHAGQCTPEARARQRASHLGRKASEESRAAQSAALKGKPFTESHRAALKAMWVRRRAAAALLTPQQQAEERAAKAQRKVDKLKALLAKEESNG
jgi:hypothetical protein